MEASMLYQFVLCLFLSTCCVLCSASNDLAVNKFLSLKERFQKTLALSKVHPRNRRSAVFNVRFPHGTNLEVEFALNIPVKTEPRYGGLFQVGIPFFYDFPDYLVDPAYTPSMEELFGLGRRKRDVEERRNIYDNIASSFDGNGYPGITCLLRTICEAHEAPLHFGLMGDFVHLLMTPSYAVDYHPNEVEDPEDLKGFHHFLEAERTGKEDGGCHIAYPECPQSMFELLPMVRNNISLY